MIGVAAVAEACNATTEQLGALAGRVRADVGFKRVARETRTGVREIIVPFGTLSLVSKLLRIFLERQLEYDAPDHVFGFVRGRSIRGNAERHLAKDCVLRIDLENFFPSISSDQVRGVFSAGRFTADATSLLTQLCTIDGRLPIGLSTSPLISNVVFRRTDEALLAVAAERQLTFTRYVDDMMFSGAVSDDDLAALVSVLESHGWAVNHHKTVFMRRGGPQYVTGLYVGCADQAHIPRRVKRQMRWIVHMISTVGYDVYMQEFGGDSCGHFPQRLRGWARFITSVEPSFGRGMMRQLDELLPESYWGADEAGWDETEVLGFREILSIDDLF